MTVYRTKDQRKGKIAVYYLIACLLGYWTMWALLLAVYVFQTVLIVKTVRK